MSVLPKKLCRLEHGQRHLKNYCTGKGKLKAKKIATDAFESGWIILLLEAIAK